MMRDERRERERVNVGNMKAQCKHSHFPVLLIVRHVHSLFLLPSPEPQNPPTLTSQALPDVALSGDPILRIIVEGAAGPKIIQRCRWSGLNRTSAEEQSLEQRTIRHLIARIILQPLNGLDRDRRRPCELAEER